MSFMFAFSYFASAQQYTFIQYSVKEGLAQSQVRCMMQDSRGYIWAATLGGVSRFDGQKFQNYDRQDGLLNNQVNCLLELKNGMIVLGSNGSFSVIDGLGVRSIPLENDFRESSVNALFQSGDELWIGTDEGLLIYTLSSGKFSLPVDEHLVHTNIRAFQTRKSGSVFILTKERLLEKTSAGTSIFYTPSNSETNFFDVTESADGTIWLAAKGEGLIRLSADGATAQNFNDHQELFAKTITGVMVDDRGELWLTSRLGFFRFDGNKFYAFTEKNGLKTPDIHDVIQDREGNIWLASYGSGILRFAGEAFSSYTTTNGLSSDAVMSITQDTTGSFWFSTYDKGICRMVNDSIMQYDLQELTSNNRIWTSITDHKGDLWFGSSDGLFRFSKGKFSFYSEKDSLSDRMVLNLFEDKEDRLWIGTAKGLTVFSSDKFSPLKIDGAPKKRVRCIRQDKAGHLWFATIEGVYRFDGERFTFFSQKDGLAENSTSCVEVDEYNRIWVGTQNGISILGAKQFISSTLGESSGANAINFLKYYDHAMWIGTNQGLYSVYVDENFDERKLSFTHYGLEDGLRSLETNLNAAYVDDKNKLWFGTTEGVMDLDPQELKQHEPEQTPPLLTMARIQLNLQDQDWSKFSSSLDTLTGLPTELRLPYKQNHITFYFTGISTTYPEAVQYQYMLEGLDEDWKSPTAANFATYSNLPYRDFTFIVKAMNREGTWSEPIRYSFSILPPFWLTWWFIALEILAASAIVFVIIYNRRRAIKEKSEKEWFEIRSKMLALEQQSLNSSMNRHFIFNALNSIQYYINRQDRLAANRYLSDFAKLIRKNLDSSQDNLTTLRDEVERLELYLKLEHMRFKDKFEYTINIDSSLDQDQVKVPAMLVQPFLENSIWHGLLPKESPGRLSVDVMRSNGSLELTITDNGIGIENSLKSKTTADSHISKGMEITQNRIDLIKKTTGLIVELHGPYQFQENDGHSTGTKVRIILPLNFHELFHH